eukprot:TRINITY_DN1324_c1_g2_i1.p1 TRINITY_DN1324_c1_g2~~TRINITY_DN1324_c1_g2_i1.p1  ORF type:complete len:301 (-),score=85.86 TRINITY_DN1324_c1_g2_i1:158-1060(-)
MNRSGVPTAALRPSRRFGTDISNAGVHHGAGKSLVVKNVMAPRETFKFKSQKDPLTDEIFGHYFDMEEDKLVQNTFLKYQAELTGNMRAIMVDWLISVAEKLGCHQQTVFVTIGILDRVLSKKVVPKRKLQLVGMTSFFLACKYEEICFPQLRDLECLSAGHVKANEILRMEKVILQAMGFKFTFPTSWLFLNRYIDDLEMSEAESGFRAQMICERMLQEYDMLAFKPSLVAAASLYVTLEIEGQPWVPEFETLTRYRAIDMTTCVSMMKTILTDDKVELRGVKKKYSSAKRLNVASLLP